jgi:hypothetical protein
MLKNLQAMNNYQMYILFCGDNLWIAVLRQMKFRTIKIMDITTTSTFIWIIILFDKTFKYDDGAIIVGYVGTTAKKSVQNSVILCNVTSL